MIGNGKKLFSNNSTSIVRTLQEIVQLKKMQKINQQNPHYQKYLRTLYRASFTDIKDYQCTPPKLSQHSADIQLSVPAHSLQKSEIKTRYHCSFTASVVRTELLKHQYTSI